MLASKGLIVVCAGLLTGLAGLWITWGEKSLHLDDWLSGKVKQIKGIGLVHSFHTLWGDGLKKPDSDFHHPAKLCKLLGLSRGKPEKSSTGLSALESVLQTPYPRIPQPLLLLLFSSLKDLEKKKQYWDRVR